MSEKQIVEAVLDVAMYVTCPNDECGNYINLLDETDTDGTDHDDDSILLRQMFPRNGDNKDFECDDVTCSQCKTTFNVKGLAW
jgi:hypothetical protein